MIEWTGRGILIIPIAFASFMIFDLIFPKELGITSSALGCFLTAIFCWYAGNKWNYRTINKKTGQEVVHKANHSLFWIKMQYWGIILGVIGAALLTIHLFTLISRCII